MIYKISETCSCGAEFNHYEDIGSSMYRHGHEEHIRFLDAHKACRTKAIISNGKELKMFIANNTKEAEVVS